MPEAELLRALDQLAKDRRWSPDFYYDDLKPAISKYLRGRVRETTAPITFPGWALNRVAELNAQRVRILSNTPVRVIGNPDTLMIKTAQRFDTTEDRPSVSIGVAAGVAGLSIDRVIETQRALERRSIEPAERAHRRANRRPRRLKKKVALSVLLLSGSLLGSGA